MPSPIDLVTLSQLEMYLNGNNANFNAAFINQNGPMAITACSQDWLGQTGRRALNRFVPCADVFDGAGGDRQFLRDFPAALVSSVYAFGTEVPEGSYGQNGMITPGWTLDEKRESISIIGGRPGFYGLGVGPGGTYTATGGPLIRQGAGWGFGVRSDNNRQNVQISYFGGGCIMFAEPQQIESGTIDLSEVANFYADLGVIYSQPQNGQLVEFVAVDAAPEVGQYAVTNTGVYTFNPGDNGNLVSVNYAYNQAPADIQGWVMVQVAEMLFKRKTIGLKSQGSPESGTTSYTWNVPRPAMVVDLQSKYKRAFVGV